MRRNVICAMLERKISPFGRNDTCDVRVVISQKRSDGEILHDEMLRFKLFKPPPRFLPRDETVSQRMGSGVSSRTNVRDLRFLPCGRNDRKANATMFSILRRSLDAGRMKEGD
jgi:hypothetical protein